MEEKSRPDTKENTSLMKKKKTSSPEKKTPGKDRKASKEENIEKKDENENKKDEESGIPKGPTGTPSVERKKSYYAYKAREGPRNLGSKELPQVYDIQFVLVCGDCYVAEDSLV